MAKASSGGYRRRFQLLRDLALNLFWGNRYAMTMYEKRPTRWRDVPRSRDDIYLPMLTPWEERRAQGGRRRRLLTRAHRRVRRRRPRTASTRSCSTSTATSCTTRRAAGDQADGPGDPGRSPPTSPSACRRYDPDYPTHGYDEILDCTEEEPSSSPAPHGDRPAQPVPVGPGRGAADAGRQIDDDEFVVAFLPRNREVREFIRRVKAGRPARPGPPARRGAEAGGALPPGRRARAVRGHAPDRVAGGRQGRAPLRQRGPDPQHGLQLVADDRRRDQREDRDRVAALHRARPRASSRCSRPSGARGGRARAGGDRRGHLLLLHEHDGCCRPSRPGSPGSSGSSRPTGRSTSSPPARASRTAWLRRCACSRRSSARCCSSAREKFSDKIGSVRTSRMIFGDGASAMVIGPAAPGAPPDIEVVQTYASGPVSQVNSIIWPNPGSTTTSPCADRRSRRWWSATSTR